MIDYNEGGCTKQQIIDKLTELKFDFISVIESVLKNNTEENNTTSSLLKKVIENEKKTESKNITNTLSACIKEREEVLEKEKTAILDKIKQLERNTLNK